MNNPIEKVWWQDAWCTAGKVKPGEQIGLTCTLGCVAKEDDIFFYVSNYFDGIQGKWSSPWTAIPKQMVVKREVICGAI